MNLVLRSVTGPDKAWALLQARTLCATSASPGSTFTESTSCVFPQATCVRVKCENPTQFPAHHCKPYLEPMHTPSSTNPIARIALYPSAIGLRASAIRISTCLQYPDAWGADAATDIWFHENYIGDRARLAHQIVRLFKLGFRVWIKSLQRF